MNNVNPPALAINIEHISKKYGSKVILKDINFKANQGDCIAIVGANGCGKSTLLNILSGCKKPDSGDITYFGQKPLSSKKMFSKIVGFIPQDNPLIEKLTVYDNLKLWYCETDRNLDEDLSLGVPKMFGLDKYKKYTVDKLSGGMKKRLSIACSIAKNPPILIFDEPGASLDIVCKQDIINYMQSYRQAGGTVIITSHEEGELKICNKMFLMKDGILQQLDERPVGADLMKYLN